jgi:hypothetical protein
LAEDPDGLGRRADDNDYIFSLPGNAVLDALVAEAADNLRFCHATSSEAKLRTFVSFMYKAGSWQQSRKVVARLECSLQPVAGETGMRQEVDIRYVVTSLAAAFGPMSRGALRPDEPPIQTDQPQTRRAASGLTRSGRTDRRRTSASQTCKNARHYAWLR